MAVNTNLGKSVSIGKAVAVPVHKAVTINPAMGVTSGGEAADVSRPDNQAAKPPASSTKTTVVATIHPTMRLLEEAPRRLDVAPKTIRSGA